MAPFLAPFPQFLRAPAKAHCKPQWAKSAPRDGCHAIAEDCALEAAVAAGKALADHRACKSAQHRLFSFRGIKPRRANWFRGGSRTMVGDISQFGVVKNPKPRCSRARLCEFLAVFSDWHAA
ncbi:MAG TPA: hypothetical protein VNH53_01070 [Sphingomicrobium sp.]|nr:hypothetical protein [Sphingomicrobium sp.]